VIYSLQALRALALSAGFPDPDLAAAVAMAESGGDSCARGDPKTASDCSDPGAPSTSFGLWQIHVPAHPEVDASRLFDPAYNAAAALSISANGTNWTPWTMYTNGKYAQYLGAGSGIATAGASSLGPVLALGVLLAAAAAGPTIRARIGRI
jgi:hypothetical protein